MFVCWRKVDGGGSRGGRGEVEGGNGGGGQKGRKRGEWRGGGGGIKGITSQNGVRICVYVSAFSATPVVLVLNCVICYIMVRGAVWCGLRCDRVVAFIRCIGYRFSFSDVIPVTSFQVGHSVACSCMRMCKRGGWCLSLNVHRYAAVLWSDK